jgi:hypothetical protein
MRLLVTLVAARGSGPQGRMTQWLQPGTGQPHWYRDWPWSPRLQLELLFGQR